MNWADLHFLRPAWLLALLPAALLFWLLWRNRLAGGSWSQICDAELLPYLLENQASPKQRHRLIGAVLATLLCIVALAGPAWQRLPSPAFRNDSALVIALDLSKSMNAGDSKPSRLAKARYKIADLLKLRKDGQTALLVFGGDAFTVTPLTNDNQTINSQLEALTTAIMPSPGSNLQLAIDKAGELLHQAGLNQGHILLVTDSDAANAKPAGEYSLSVLAVGSEDGAPIPLPSGGFLKDGNGNMVIAKLDSAGLSALAASGNGLYQAASVGDDDIQHLSALFNRAAPGSSREQSDLQLDQWEDMGPWLILLLLPWAALRFRKGLLSLALLCLLPLPRPAQAFDWQGLWQTADQQAQQAFDQQQFDKAASGFENPDWRAAAQYRAGQYQEAAETLKDNPSADGQYNRGNALAKAGDLQQAIDAYREALKLDPNHADAKYNKELVEKALEKQIQQQQAQNQQGDDQQQDQQQNQDGQNQGQNQDQAKQQQEQGQQQQAQANQQQNGDQQDQKDAEAKAADQAEEKDAKDKNDQTRQAANADQQAQSEAQRAHQQMLKRIPDEPTGLLKRKFRYQYRQRQPIRNSGQDW